MSRTAKRSVALFVVMMATLASLGTINQSRLRQQGELLTLKSELIVARGELRRQAEMVRGPHAVRAWASGHGMVPALENRTVVEVMPQTGPALQALATGLEVDTRWR